MFSLYTHSNYTDTAQNGPEVACGGQRLFVIACLQNLAFLMVKEKIRLFLRDKKARSVDIVKRRTYLVPEKLKTFLVTLPVVLVQ